MLIKKMIKGGRNVLVSLFFLSLHMSAGSHRNTVQPCRAFDLAIDTTSQPRSSGSDFCDFFFYFFPTELGFTE